MAEINGYAPGNYVSECFSCHKLFEGDKHAVWCFSCAVSAQKQGQIALETQLAAKTEECERLREDQKRLRWLISNRATVLERPLGGYCVITGLNGPLNTSDHWREAIDEARGVADDS